MQFLRLRTSGGGGRWMQRLQLQDGPGGALRRDGSAELPSGGTESGRLDLVGDPCHAKRNMNKNYLKSIDHDISW